MFGILVIVDREKNIIKWIKVERMKIIFIYKLYDFILEKDFINFFRKFFYLYCRL